MVCKKSIVNKIIILLAVIIMIILGSLAVRAEYLGDTTLVYNGQEIKLYYSTNCSYTYGSKEYYIITDNLVYFCPLYNGNFKYYKLLSFEPFNYMQGATDISDTPSTSASKSTVNGVDFYVTTLMPSVSTSAFAFNNVNIPDADLYRLFVSDDFQPVSGKFDYTYANDKPFKLSDFNAKIEDNSVICNWGKLSFDTMSYIPFPDTENSLVRFSYILYPREGSGETRPIKFKQEKPISFNLHTYTVLLDDIGVTENYYLYKLMATPYYYDDDNTENALYSGYTSCVYFDEDGQVVKAFVEDGDYAEDLPPDADNVHMTIYEKISYFFSSFFVKCGDMLKDLFIPTKEQMQGLFVDLQDFFSDKLGFLWFPFDLAITIVDTFTYGSADSVITVPPISINILGGIKLYSGGQFDMDAVGIFPYVRMITSIVLACGVASLAYKKWDEWIGGHDN